jgi:hypothetical protein
VKTSRSIFEPLTQPEVAALLTLTNTQPPVNTDADPTVLDSLRERGYLIKTKAGLIVTPEGLAALLDSG